jgi:hypothetical protein
LLARLTIYASLIQRPTTKQHLRNKIIDGTPTNTSQVTEKSTKGISNVGARRLASFLDQQSAVTTIKTFTEHNY